MIDPIVNTADGKVLLVAIPTNLVRTYIMRSTNGNIARLGMRGLESKNRAVMQIIRYHLNDLESTAVVHFNIVKYSNETDNELVKIGIYPLNEEETNVALIKSKLANIDFQEAIFDHVEHLLSK
jgi:hypothetical protein